MRTGSIWLRTEGDYVIVLFEYRDKWFEVIRERRDAPFSHILEVEGLIEAVVKKL